MKSNIYICQLKVFKFHHFIRNRKPLKTLELRSIIISAMYAKTPPDNCVQGRLEENENSKEAIAFGHLGWLPKLVENVTLDFRVLSASPIFSVKPIKKKKQQQQYLSPQYL